LEGQNILSLRLQSHQPSFKLQVVTRIRIQTSTRSRKALRTKPSVSLLKVDTQSSIIGCHLRYIIFRYVVVYI